MVSLSAKAGHGGQSSSGRQGAKGQHHLAGWQRSQSREARWPGRGGASAGKGGSQRRGRGSVCFGASSAKEGFQLPEPARLGGPGSGVSSRCRGTGKVMH